MVQYEVLTESLLLYYIYSIVSEIITKRFSIIFPRNSLLFVDITKPQSLTTKTVALHGVYIVVYKVYKVYKVRMLITTRVTIAIALTANTVIVIAV